MELKMQPASLDSRDAGCLLRKLHLRRTVDR